MTQRAVDAATPVRFSRHAVERFVERCRPALDFAQAEQELERLMRAP